MISSFTPLTAATQAGTKVNEDGYGCWPAEAPRAAWVLDGVTGINDRALLPGPTDAAWFVAQVQEALPALLSRTPDLPAAVCVVLHTSPESQGYLASILKHAGPLPARVADDGERIEHGRVYLAPPGRHLLVKQPP